MCLRPMPRVAASDEWKTPQSVNQRPRPEAGPQGDRDGSADREHALHYPNNQYGACWRRIWPATAPAKACACETRASSTQPVGGSSSFTNLNGCKSETSRSYRYLESAGWALRSSSHAFLHLLPLLSAQDRGVCKKSSSAGCLNRGRLRTSRCSWGLTPLRQSGFLKPIAAKNRSLVTQETSTCNLPTLTWGTPGRSSHRSATALRIPTRSADTLVPSIGKGAPGVEGPST